MLEKLEFKLEKEHSEVQRKHPSLSAKYSDIELWESFKNGDETALIEIYDKTYKYLYNYGKRISPDSKFIEDCIQELFIDLIKKKASLGSTDNIRFYLLTSLKRRILRVLNKADKKLYTNELLDDYNFTFTPSLEKEIINNQITAEKALKLTYIINKLSPRQKEAIYLRFYNDLSNKEIAVIMELTHQSVKTLIYRAFITLKDEGASFLSFSAIFLYMFQD